MLSLIYVHLCIEKTKKNINSQTYPAMPKKDSKYLVRRSLERRRKIYGLQLIKITNCAIQFKKKEYLL
jgi:hypothetical protein